MLKKFALPAILVAIVAVAGILGAFNFSSAYAQSATETPTAAPTSAAPSTGQTPGNPMPGKGFGRRTGSEYNQQDLATALGIDLTKLQAAYQTANTEALKEAVANGLITQAQADAITARGLTNGPIGDLGHFFGLNTQTSSTIDYNALLAKALGITTDQLNAAYLKAYDTAIDNAVTAGRLTQAQADLIKGREALAGNAAFQSSMQTAFQNAVKQAVTDGVITQAQADAILQAQQNRTGSDFDFGKGFEGGRGFGRGWFQGFFDGNSGSNNSASPTPTSSGM